MASYDLKCLACDQNGRLPDNSAASSTICFACSTGFLSQTLCLQNHYNQGGWKLCSCCAKALHTGCICRADKFSLSEAGAVICEDCVDLDSFLRSSGVDSQLNEEISSGIYSLLNEEIMPVIDSQLNGERSSGVDSQLNEEIRSGIDSTDFRRESLTAPNTGSSSPVQHQDPPSSEKFIGENAAVEHSNLSHMCLPNTGASYSVPCPSNVSSGLENFIGETVGTEPNIHLAQQYPSNRGAACSFPNPPSLSSGLETFNRGNVAVEQRVHLPQAYLSNNGDSYSVPHPVNVFAGFGNFNKGNVPVERNARLSQPYLSSGGGFCSVPYLSSGSSSYSVPNPWNISGGLVNSNAGNMFADTRNNSYQPHRSFRGVSSSAPHHLNVSGGVGNFTRWNAPNETRVYPSQPGWSHRGTSAVPCRLNIADRLENLTLNSRESLSVQTRVPSRLFSGTSSFVAHPLNISGGSKNLKRKSVSVQTRGRPPKNATRVPVPTVPLGGCLNLPRLPYTGLIFLFQKKLVPSDCAGGRLGLPAQYAKVYFPVPKGVRKKPVAMKDTEGKTWNFMLCHRYINVTDPSYTLEKVGDCIRTMKWKADDILKFYRLLPYGDNVIELVRHTHI